jgi:hypothetical protein
MDHATLNELVDLADHLGKLFACFFLGSQRFKVANGVTGGLAIVTVPVPALGGLAYVVLGCLMICHDASLSF